jgi:hypothetical protein
MAIKSDPNKVQVFPAHDPKSAVPLANEEMCTVLYGYGKVAPTQRTDIDNYKGFGGVFRNIPRSVAQCWAKGTRPDGKPATSRVFIQAILPADANEVEFAQATGIQPMEPTQLAAMIGATDAQALIEALGAQKTLQLIEELKDLLPKHV